MKKNVKIGLIIGLVALVGYWIFWPQSDCNVRRFAGCGVLDKSTQQNSEEVMSRYKFYSSAIDLDGTAECHEVKDLVITIQSGRCEKADIPDKIAVGDKISANGDTMTINYIVADKILQDYPDLGLKAGQTTCTAVEKLENLPEEHNTGKWIYIKNCSAEF